MQTLLGHSDINFNPPSPCGEGLCDVSVKYASLYFNPPSPCGEGLICTYTPGELTLFQSTLPVWGGTGGICPLDRSPTYFNPPSPCGEGHANHPVCRPAPWYFNPPSPCGEGLNALADRVRKLEFQSTLPVWGGTAVVSGRQIITEYFNPPSPCGEGRTSKRSSNSSLQFQSTLPVWGGT